MHGQRRLDAGIGGDEAVERPQRGGEEASGDAARAPSASRKPRERPNRRIGAVV